MMLLKLRRLNLDDPKTIASAFASIGWNKPELQYQRYLSEQSDGTRSVILAEWGGLLSGYVTVQFSSEYEQFQRLGIPEIKDLNVLPAYRRRGIATTLIRAAEKELETDFSSVGVGFGLSQDYGPAQRLYVTLGYVPDGYGVSYLGRTPKHGSDLKLDDDLVLYLVKPLKTSDE